MKILPVEYGIAGYLSVVARGPDDGHADYERALTDAAVQTLVSSRLRRTHKDDEAMRIAISGELSRLREQNAALANALCEFSQGALEAVAPGSLADIQDIDALRRENRGLRASLEWHVSRLAELLPT